MMILRELSYVRPKAMVIRAILFTIVKTALLESSSLPVDKQNFRSLECHPRCSPRCNHCLRIGN